MTPGDWALVHGFLVVVGTILLTVAVASLFPPPKPRDDAPAREAYVDHALKPLAVYLTPARHWFNAELTLPLIEQAMAAYRFGPPRSEVYHLLRHRHEEAIRCELVGLSYEDIYFITTSGGITLENLYAGHVREVGHNA